MMKLCAVAMATGILTFALFFAANLKTVSAPGISGKAEIVQEIQQPENP